MTHNPILFSQPLLRNDHFKFANDVLNHGNQTVPRYCSNKFPVGQGDNILLAIQNLPIMSIHCNY